MRTTKTIATVVGAAILALTANLLTEASSRSVSRTPNGLTVVVNPRSTIRPISPLILGVSGDVDETYIRDVGITLNSWGGNPSTRYNYKIGNAWNAGADYEFRNGNYGATGEVARQFVAESLAAGAQVRLAVPTLGWVAKDDRNSTCSFPQPGGGCGGGNGANCKDGGPVADPGTANVPSTPKSVTEWVRRLVREEKLDLRYIAMDNEPELWGSTHFDVHPSCPTYEEILDRYLAYATALKEVAPASRMTGPVMCCWYSFWKTAPGPSKGPNEDFVSWFLKSVRKHDVSTGRRTLDVLDVHYYPQSDVFNDKADPFTSARRLRSTRSLFDPKYKDESWIASNIRLIPRLRETIAKDYPGTGLAISEWNFGADNTMNGALAIADVLGIYGREGVDAAAYWRSPKRASPGYFAFKMFGNYDGKGSRFSGVAVAALSSDVDRVSSFGAIDPSSGVLRVVLINKDPSNDQPVSLGLTNVGGSDAVGVFRYSDADPSRIVGLRLDRSSLSRGVVLPRSSITMLEFKSTTGRR